MSNEKVSTSLSKEQLTKTIVEVASKEVQRLIQQTIDKIAEQYSEVAEEKTKNEMEKVNGMITQKYPERGTLVITLSSGDIELPFDSESVMTITLNPLTNLEKSRTFKADEINDRDLLELCEFIEEGNGSYAVITTKSVYDFEMYDEKEFEKNKKPVVLKKHYVREYKGMFNTGHFKGIHTLFAKISDSK